MIKKFVNFKNKFITRNHIKGFFSENTLGKPNGKRILMYVGIGHMYISYFEILLYHLLKKEGYDVDYIIYDEHVPINELITKTVIETKGKEAFWNEEISKAKRLLNNANVTYEYISSNRQEVLLELSSKENDLESIYRFQIDGIHLGEIVKGTMYRYYKSLTFDDDALKVAQKFLRTTLINYFEIKNRTNKKEYDFVLFSHGIYVTWEPVAEFCKHNNIEFIAYDRAKTNNTININFNQVGPDWSFNTAWERYKNKTLTASEKIQVTNYIKDREMQANDVYAYNFSKRSKDVDALKNKLGIPFGKKVITIFTNLIWDAANVARDIAFDNAFQCVTQTIEYYKNNEEVQILLRTHPAEKVLGTKERYGVLVLNYFKHKLPENVTIIEPEMAVNSFSVIDISDIGVVNTSTVGLEFALLGKPIVLISETHYRNKGFTYDVDSTVDYFKTIDKLLLNAVLKLNQVELAEKYFYMMMFKYQHFIPLEYDAIRFKKYAFEKLNAIPEYNEIYKIIDRIKEGDPKDFIFWDE
jgi:hypothetical protein